MPLVSRSGYIKKPFYLWNAHWETILPSMLFKGPDQEYKRERLELPDGDFLDIDWVRSGSKKCMIISHGLEGNSRRYYVKRTSKYFSERGWDIAAWNCRSCSGEMNRLPRFYHHGDTEDLHQVVNHVYQQGYTEVVLFGYSMGGSMSLKYLGERKTDSRIKGGVFYSVPCNLRDSSDQLAKKSNRIYEQRFLKKLKEKIRNKAEDHEEVSSEGIDDLKSFDEFHDRYTAPLHGFRDKEEFFIKASCESFLKNIKVPVLVVNAANDPLLGKACYPTQLAERHRDFYLEVPSFGGHCGFTLVNKSFSYMESRADSFIQESITVPS